MVNRAKRLTGLNPLAYMGVEPVSPPQFVTQDFNPTVNDWQNFNLGTIWLNTATEGIWMLVSLQNNQAKWVLIGIGGGDVLTLTGNDAVIVSPDGAGNIDIITNNATVKFGGTPNTLTQDFGLSNLVLGSSIPAVNIGLRNVGLGDDVLIAVTDGSDNTAVGFDSLSSLTTGSSNTALGSGSGNIYTTESNNIVIGNTGTAADSGVIRIGTNGTQTSAFISGVAGVAVANTNMVTIDTVTGELGSQAVPGVGGLGFFVGFPRVILNNTGSITYTGLYSNTDSTTIATVESVIPMNGTLSNMYVDVGANANTSSGTITLNINGVNTALQVTIPALTTGVFSDLINSVNVNAGDLIVFEKSQATVGTSIGTMNIKFVPT